MRITNLLAAVTMIVSVTTAASAQDYRHDNRDGRRYEHRDDRRDDRRHGWRGGERRYGYNGHRRACHTEYRHHRRVTVCYR